MSDPTTALRVLVVEDDAVIAMHLGGLVEEMGYAVCASEATEAGAVAAAARCSPDLMIVDAGLLEGSGVDAVATICRTEVVPHVFISGDVARVTRLRPDAVVVQKPFHKADLVRAVQRALDATGGHSRG
jgi:DNA-binding response OmpR family regulator